MKIDSKGVTRLVFILNKIVIKIPNFTCQWDHFLKGLIGNINEDKTDIIAGNMRTAKVIYCVPFYGVVGEAGY